jgi:hypothetical protein
MVDPRDFMERLKDAESRRLGPCITGHVSAPSIDSIEDQAMWMVIRKVFKDTSDVEFAARFGVWITLK